MKRNLTNLMLFFSVMVALLLASPAFAQEGAPGQPSDDEVNAVAKQMYCPVCENTPLDVCPTQACAEWRDLIRDKLAEGWSEQQIKDYFVEQFGDRVLAVPPARGLNWLVYILPPVIFIAGVFILYRAFRMWQQPVSKSDKMKDAEEGASQADSMDDEYISLLEDELQNRS